MQPNHDAVDFQQLDLLGRLVARLSADVAGSMLPAVILSAALELTTADGGAIHLPPTPEILCCEAVQIVSLNLYLSGEDMPADLPIISLSAGSPVKQSHLLRTFQGNHSVLVEDISEADVFSDHRVFDKAFGYRSESLLFVPLSGFSGECIGVLQLMNPQSGNFSKQDQLLVTHLATSAGCLLKKQRQLDEQKELFESTIQMIAGAVDEKFYFGADHCRRVPVLTMMLAQAVNRTNEPPFAGQVFDNQELYELEVAAWLHDCGKLVTPINLVDKSRKLETIFDRIDLIQNRFEIIRRDEEIARLRAGQAKDGLPVLSDGRDRSQQIMEDMHFLSACNHGDKTLTEHEQQRISQIAEQYQWIDRQMEELSVLTGDEIANLSIESGTINERERVKINNHALATVAMLDLLPFPSELQQVPDIVGGYHENRDEQPLLQAQILAIADSFVSVTVENRSYRKVNNLDETMEILFEMRDAGKFDADLLDLFVRERLHQQYAAEFLSEEQSGFSSPK